MASVINLLVLLVLLGVCVALLVQVSSLSWRVRDVERQLGELRLAAVPSQREPPAPSPVPASPAKTFVRAVPIVTPAIAAATPATASTVPIASLAAEIPATASSAPEDQWEILVGTNWLNKLGVLVFVIGVALLVRYSIAHVGPVGRIAIGFAASGALLAIGVVMSRRVRYRMFGHGLTAGGWAGVYFTTFAMHGIPAARLIDNDLAGTLLLLVVAAGMILHALAARSESMTALAFVVGYATLVLSPLTMFAAMAVVPLAAATVVVAGRLGWTRVALLGAVATYAIFPLRDALQAPLLIDRHSPTLYIMLGLYWTVFECADIVSARGRGAADRGFDRFVVNTLGALGVGVLELPNDDTGLAAAVMACGGLAYFVSAIVRTRQAHRAGAPVLGVERVTSTHLAIGTSAMLIALAAATRFNEARAMLVTCFETELVLASAVLLKDRIVRAIAATLATGATCYGIHLGLNSAHAPTIWDSTLLQIASVSAVWFANREWLRARATSLALDSGYSWAGTVIAVVLILGQSTTILGGLVLLVVGAALVEAGLQNREDYRLQGYVLGTIATIWIAGYFTQVPRPADIRADAWHVLPAAAFLAGALALHLSRHRRAMETRVAAMLAAWATVGFIALFELTVIGHHANAGAWAFTGFALATIGTVRRSATLRWQGYALACLGATTAVATDLAAGLGHDLFWAVAGVCAIYGVYLVTRPIRTAGGDDDPVSSRVERVVCENIAALASVLVFVLWARHGDDNRITLDWGLTAIALLTAGTVLRERTLRWCGLTGLLACLVRLTFHDLPQLEAAARITVFVVLGLVLIGASWIYTRFRERVS